jgi:hypothetical protein
VKLGQSARVLLVLTVTFAVPPRIESFSFPENIQAGARVHVTCVVSEGDPPVRIVWLKDGRPLGSYRELDAATNQIGEFDLALRITSASPAHNGNYTCLASNDAAKTSRTARLLVHGTQASRRPLLELLREPTRR